MPRLHVWREVMIGVRLGISGEVAEQNVGLDLRALCGTSHAEAHDSSVLGSVEQCSM